MDQIVDKVFQIAHGMWRRRWIALLVAWPIAILGGVAVMTIKDRYEATARVYVDTQTVLKPLMSGLAFQPDIDQQVAMLARTLLSRPNVERLIANPSLGLQMTGPGANDREIERLMLAIKVTPSSKNLYSVAYRDVDPDRAQRVVKGLVELFVDSGLGEKRRDSEEARRFIDEQIHTYEGKLAESENRLKEFKLKNFGVVGASNQDYFSRVSSLSDEVAKLRLDLSAAEQSRDALKRELANEDPRLPQDPNVPEAPSELDTRIAAQEKQLDDLLRRYTDEHPDVIATRRSLNLLQRQKQQESAARAAGKGRVGNAATSPVYQRIRISLAEAEANVASLRSQLSMQQGRLDQIRATAGKVPQAEADLAQLNRDYEVLRRNYEQLVARRESASLGVKLDESAQLADFRIVEPPRVDPKAVFPNRQILALFTLVCSLGVGVAVAFGLNQIFPTFHAPSELRELSGRPVLGGISMHVDAQVMAAERRDLLAFVGITVLLVLCHVVWIGWLTFRAHA